MTRADTPSGPAGAGRPRVRNLLGIYPVPLLHLVGVPVPASPRMPIRWRPPAPPPQYGIDYSFLNGSRDEPVGWLPQRPIMVRIAARHTAHQASTLAQVVAELRRLTGLPLRLGAPWPAEFDPDRVPGQEIHVSFAPVPQAPCLTGLGYATLSATGHHYTSGYVAIHVVTAQPVPDSARTNLTALRHGLAHALGLGHAARPSLLMYHRVPADEDEYGPGDRYGLALLGQGRSIGNHPSPHHPRSFLCAV